MIQTFCMVFWCEPQSMTVSEMVNFSYSVMKTLRGYGDELNHKYLTVSKKSDIKEFELGKDNLRKVIEKSINKEGNRLFNDLSRRFGFFSSLDEEKSSGLSIAVGGTNPMFNNTVTVSLPYVGFSGFSDRKEDFYQLFKSLTSIINPYFAFIYNNLNKQLSYEFWDEKPTYVHWMNYYSPNTMNKIGAQKIKSLENIEFTSDGAFLKLFDEPLDVDNQSHLDKQREVSKLLDLL